MTQPHHLKTLTIGLVTATGLLTGPVVAVSLATPAQAATKNAKATFNANGGKVSGHSTKKITVTKGKALGKKLPKSSVTIKTGNTFKGWYTAKSAGKKISTKTKVSKSSTFYAHWTLKSYRLIFNANGGSAVPTRSVKYLASYGTLPTSKKAGYTLVGWFQSPTSPNRVSASSKMTSHNTTVYAHWTPANTQTSGSGSGSGGTGTGSGSGSGGSGSGSGSGSGTSPVSVPTVPPTAPPTTPGGGSGSGSSGSSGGSGSGSSGSGSSGSGSSGSGGSSSSGSGSSGSGSSGSGSSGSGGSGSTGSGPAPTGTPATISGVTLSQADPAGPVTAVITGTNLSDPTQIADNPNSITFNGVAATDALGAVLFTQYNLRATATVPAVAIAPIAVSGGLINVIVTNASGVASASFSVIFNPLMPPLSVGFTSNANTTAQCPTWSGTAGVSTPYNECVVVNGGTSDAITLSAAYSGDSAMNAMWTQAFPVDAYSTGAVSTRYTAAFPSGTQVLPAGWAISNTGALTAQWPAEGGQWQVVINGHNSSGNFGDTLLVVVKRSPTLGVLKGTDRPAQASYFSPYHNQSSSNIDNSLTINLAMETEGYPNNAFSNKLDVTNSSFTSLSIPQQLIIAFNAVRSVYGLSQLTENSSQDAIAQAGADQGKDANGNSTGGGGYDSTTQPLDAIVGWLYADGFNSDWQPGSSLTSGNSFGHRLSIMGANYNVVGVGYNSSLGITIVVDVN